LKNVYPSVIEFSFKIDIWKPKKCVMQILISILCAFFTGFFASPIPSNPVHIKTILAKIESKNKGMSLFSDVNM